MEKRNSVFIATSMDGYIADKNGGIEWLHSIPNPENIDMGYQKFIDTIDAIIMGRNTFETICGFDVDWPYTKPVFVLSNSLREVPENYKDKVSLVNKSLSEILNQIHNKGYTRLYIDGGATIQSFLKEDLIDDMTITIIPVLLGGGISLFSALPDEVGFECRGPEIYLDRIVQNRFRRIK